MEDFFIHIKDAFTGTQNILVSILDILLYAAFLFIVFKFLKKNDATRLILFIVPMLILGAIFTSAAFGFVLLGKLFSYTILFAVLAIIILFPAETRRGLWRIASSPQMRESFNTVYNASDEDLKEAIDGIVRAAQNLAKKNTGALIVVVPESLPAHILESGTTIDGRITAPLIETVFHNKTPLHDGALCIHGDRIMAAGCFLPLSQNNAIDKELGTRHRAAIGVTEAYNVFAIIVSEETGVISTARDGLLTRYYDSVMLTDVLLQIYGLKAVPQRDGRTRTRTRTRTRAKTRTGTKE